MHWPLIVLADYPSCHHFFPGPGKVTLLLDYSFTHSFSFYPSQCTILDQWQDHVSKVMNNATDCWEFFMSFTDVPEQIYMIGYIWKLNFFLIFRSLINMLYCTFNILIWILYEKHCLNYVYHYIRNLCLTFRNYNIFMKEYLF